VVRDLEEVNLTDRHVIEQRIREIGDRQIASDARKDASPASAPFPLEKMMRPVVEIVCVDNTNKEVYFTGSGTVIDKSGLIVTNEHILLSDNGSQIKFCGIGFTENINVPPRIDFIAATVAVHKEADLALMQINEHVDRKPLPAEFPAVSLIDAAKASKALLLGDTVYIGGYPNVGADTFTFTQGVVSGRVGDSLIKTSALIDTGASGGAAFDARGRYVGMPSAAARGEIGGSLGYLIAADAVDAFLVEYYAGQRGLDRAP
jgi:S1-C subfamily serine protease